MTAFNGKSATELAGLLDTVEQFPHYTGLLSMLDEATLTYYRVRVAQHKFSEARHAHKLSYNPDTGKYSDAAWLSAMEAAHALADALRSETEDE